MVGFSKDYWENPEIHSFGRFFKRFPGAGPCIFALEKPARGGPKTAKNPLRGQKEEKPGREEEKARAAAVLCYITQKVMQLGTV